jgi:uncharacterized tellurite resistance protein B-like protein
MPLAEIVMPLAKVMIAAAWADGSITRDEINSLKDLLFQLPEMTASDWAQLDIYIDTPVSPTERERLIAELQNALSKREQVDLAILMIDELIHTDGEISAAELEAAEQIKRALQETNVGVFGNLTRLLKGSINRRAQAYQKAPNRELFMDDFQKNRIFYNLSRRLALADSEIQIQESELRKLSLAGGLMARVAYVDRDVNENEFNTMVKAIRDHWGISDHQAGLVAEVAISEISKGLDYYRLSREFFLSTSEEERLRFLDALFSVADGDGRVSYDEIEEIRSIANGLKCTHRQFIDAKLRIPRERRDG